MYVNPALKGMPDVETWSEETEGLCPECLRTVPARLYTEQNRVWMSRTCPRHGASSALLASDATEYLRLRQYVPARVSGGCCGGDDSSCDSGPPVCVLLLEITQACNLRCPTCYADAHGHDFMPIPEIRRRLDSFFRQQARLDLLMLSGGEPTIHPQFTEILEIALEYPINRVLINTNGLRLHQSDALVESIAGHGERVELYFSFASFRKDVHERLYGKDLRVEKQSALERSRQAGIFVNLVPTVERGVNEDEIGDLYHFGLSLDNISGITYQPVMSAGRYENGYAAEQRLTMTDVLKMLEQQTDGALRTTDFVGLPCSHPDCCSLTYGFLDEGRTTITPLPRHLDVARYLDLFTDRISFAGILSGAARRVWSDVTHLRAGQTLRDITALFARAGVHEILALRNDPKAVGKRIFRIVVKPFMDAHTYDHKRISQCCTKILNEEGNPISFCEYNVFHRGRKPRENTIPLTLRV
jgi:uncharacterized radical SAM superfamily Fe-S cluster-containing enzyme